MIIKKHGRLQTFFQGRAKTQYLPLKTPKKHTIFLEKSRKTYYFGQPEGGKDPLLPSPADAHVKRYLPVFFYQTEY
jgi:hypothetical protein